MRFTDLLREVLDGDPTEVCLCGDHREAHMHHREGTDCSRCNCRRFRKDRKNYAADRLTSR